MRSITVYTDGGSRPNPGQSAYGMIYFIDGGRVGGHGRYLGERFSNNYAEYQGVIHGLRRIMAELEGIADRGVRARVTPTLYADSELVIKQLRGEYQCRKHDLIPLFTECRDLMNEIGERLQLRHVPRACNSLADSLVRRARDVQGSVYVKLKFTRDDDHRSLPPPPPPSPPPPSPSPPSPKSKRARPTETSGESGHPQKE